MISKRAVLSRIAEVSTIGWGGSTQRLRACPCVRFPLWPSIVSPYMRVLLAGEGFWAADTAKAQEWSMWLVSFAEVSASIIDCCVGRLTGLLWPSTGTPALDGAWYNAYCLNIVPKRGCHICYSHAQFWLSGHLYGQCKPCALIFINKVI